MLKKLRHVGIMAEDLERAIQKFKGFGLPCTEVIENKKIGLQVAFLPIGETFLEFIHHTEPDEGNDALASVVRRKEDSSITSVLKWMTWKPPSGILKGLEQNWWRAAQGLELMAE